jgi:hypothetical protein
MLVHGKGFPLSGLCHEEEGEEQHKDEGTESSQGMKSHDLKVPSTGDRLGDENRTPISE